jgi:hypothetical protein
LRFRAGQLLSQFLPGTHGNCALDTTENAFGQGFV